MKYLQANRENIKLAAEIIKQGGLVAFPTETVYGLGANGLDSIAAAKIFEAKNRPTFNPLILHINSIDMLKQIAEVQNKKAVDLMERFWPGPLTLVLKKKETVPEIITAGHSTVAVRMPANKIALELIEKSGVPIAAPSANSFGQLSPTKAQHVKKQLGDKVDVILDGGATEVGIESTILEVTESEIFLLRPGGLAVESIEEIAGELKSKINESNPNSPGQLKYHYSPAKPIKFLDSTNISEITGKDAVLFFQKEKPDCMAGIKMVLSDNGNLRVAAANLFKRLHELEESEADNIYVERVPEKGLGKAIMDRLIKATNKYKD